MRQNILFFAAVSPKVKVKLEMVRKTFSNVSMHGLPFYLKSGTFSVVVATSSFALFLRRLGGFYDVAFPLLLAWEFFFLVDSFKNRKLTRPLFMENCDFRQCYLSNERPTSMITKHGKSIDNGNQQNTMTPDLLGGLGTSQSASRGSTACSRKLQASRRQLERLSAPSLIGSRAAQWAARGAALRGLLRGSPALGLACSDRVLLV